MESRERLRLWSDSTWPADDFTLEANRDDLIEHEEEWENRKAFAYTVLNPDGTRCEGCVYILQFTRSMRNRGFNPDESIPRFDDYAAVVSFWVRDSALVRQLDRELLTGMRKWFAEDWPFSAVVYRINDNQSHDRELFINAGLDYRSSHATESSPLMWHLYTEPASTNTVT